MTADLTYLYFAYGSNMATARLCRRTSSARPVGIGRLDGHVLRWHKRSRDGSGKCDAAVDPGGPGGVWGVLYEIALAEKSLLDRVEGLHCGYEEKEVEVVARKDRIQVTMYYATEIDAALRPYQWYKDFVVAGAREHSLPPAYRTALESTEAVPDPDLERTGRNSSILAGRQRVDYSQ